MFKNSRGSLVLIGIFVLAGLLNLDVSATLRRMRLSNYQWLLFNGNADESNSTDLIYPNNDFLQFRNRNMQRRINELRERRICGFANCMKSAVVFKYYNSPAEIRTFAQDDEIPCDFNGKFAFILHGWKQSCDSDWVHELVERLHEYRGGCIICIDYSLIAKFSYFKLSKSFEIISYTIAAKMQTLIDKGFDPQNGFMFGFSFGGQLATAVGLLLGTEEKFKNIDTCDMAGPGFDIKFPDVNHRPAAANVQCFHTSADKGTLKYECHQNIRFGNCGYSQPAVSSQTRYGSHGLCVQMYINAFEYPFYALPRQPYWCSSVNPAKDIPIGYTVGYRDKVDVFGEVFVPTGTNYPYNLSIRELARLDF